MLFNRIIVVGVIGLFLFPCGCQYDPKTEGQLGKEFRLNRGQQLEFEQEHLTITFIDVPNDNRCKGVCAWEGYADVVVQVTGDREKIDALILNTTDQRGYSSTKDFGDYSIKLLKLDSTGYIFSDYSVTMLVTTR